MSAAGTKPILPWAAAIYTPLKPLAWPVIRFSTGLFLVPHGAQKLFGWFGGGGLNATTQGFAKMGFEPAGLMAALAGGTEFFAGLLIALGLLTRPAAIAAVILLGTAISVHLGNGFFWVKGGYEYPMLWLVLCAAIAVRGGGNLSMDRALGREF